MFAAVLTIDYPPHRWIGAELATHELVLALRSAGHRVAVFTTANDVGPYEYDGVPVTPGAHALVAGELDPDVVIAHAELGARLRRRFVPRRPATPLVAVTHNARRTMLESMSSAPWSLFVHNAQHTAAELAAGRGAVPYVVVPPPVWAADIDVDRSDADAVTLVNVTGEKGSDTFYELAARLPDRRFLGVVGGWGEPDIRDRPNVEIVEHGTEMLAVWEQTRVLLMPSEHEAYGRVGVEACAAGVPVIATDLPGPREALGLAGRFVAGYWFDEWERQLVELDDPAVYEAASTAARAHALACDPYEPLASFVASVETIVRGG